MMLQSWTVSSRFASALARMGAICVAFVLLVSSGLAQEWEHHLILNGDLRNVTSSSFVDLDSDDDEDILLAANGQIGIYEQLAPGLYAPLKVVHKEYRLVSHGFFNDDDLPDLILGRGIGSQLKFYVAMNLDGLEFSIDFITPIYNYEQIADLNEDGFDDLLIDDGQGSFSIAWNLQGTSFSEPEYFLNSQGAIVSHGLPRVHFNDYDQDGDLDAFSINEQNTAVLLSVNSGNGNFQPAVPIYSSPSLGDAEFVVKDINLDGFDDVIWHHSQFVFLLRNINGNFENSPIKMLQNNFLSSFQIADIDSDGYPDLLEGGTFSKNQPGRWFFRPDKLS